MNTEKTDGNHSRNRVPDSNLNELKDTAAILTMAGEYLCEEAYLEKYVITIEKNIEVLRSHVADLKKQLVGKKNREDEPPVDDDLEQISRVASLFQKIDSDTKDKCIKGELGEELGAKIPSLAMGINELKEKVEGRPVKYTKTESALGMFSQLKSVVSAITGLFKFAFKMFVLLIVICIIPFFYLYFTMDSEKDWHKQIEQESALLSSKKADISQIKGELKQVREAIESIKKTKKPSSQEKIKLMDLNMKVVKLLQDQQRAENDIRSSEKALEESLGKLEEMKKKTFMEKLLSPLSKWLSPLEKKWNAFFGASPQT